MSKKTNALVSILMGSKSDLAVVNKAADILKEFGVSYSINVSSAHRSHKRTMELVQSLDKNGTRVFIACAGGAAHLPGVVAALTHLPVIGVPVKGAVLDGLDSLLSIVQMPSGMPVATVSVNGAVNAAVLAVQILALNDNALKEKFTKYRNGMIDKIMKDDASIQ